MSVSVAGTTFGGGMAHRSLAALALRAVRSAEGVGIESRRQVRERRLLQRGAGLDHDDASQSGQVVLDQLTAALTGAAKPVLASRKEVRKRGVDIDTAWEAMGRYERFQMLDVFVLGESHATQHGLTRRVRHDVSKHGDPFAAK